MFASCVFGYWYLCKEPKVPAATIFCILLIFRVFLCTTCSFSGRSLEQQQYLFDTTGARKWMFAITPACIGSVRIRPSLDSVRPEVLETGRSDSCRMNTDTAIALEADMLCQVHKCG